MISLLLVSFILLVYAQFPEDVLQSMEHSQWILSDSYKQSPCVAIDAHVRFRRGNLIVNVAGICNNMQTNTTVCEFRDSKNGYVVRTNSTVIRAPSSETRGGQISRLLLSKSQYNNILMWHALTVDCGIVPINEGTITIVYGDSQIKKIGFKTPVLNRTVSDIAVCTRLYDIRVWKPWHTAKFIEWLNWNFALGVSCVHLYVHSLRSSEMWNVIQHYQRQYKIVLHDWSEKSSHGAVANGWEFLQVSHISDCMLRLEGTFRYVGAYDHDEFINLKTIHNVAKSLITFLDDLYLMNRDISNVIAFDPYIVYSKPCDEPDETLKVAEFCHACDTSFGSWTKYFVRFDNAYPLEMLPYIHDATDGRKKIIIDKSKAWIMHVNRDESQHLHCPEPISIEWNAAISRFAWQLVLKEDAVKIVYSNNLNSKHTPSRIQHLRRAKK